MLRRFVYRLGVALILVALAALPSEAIVSSYVGGSAFTGPTKTGATSSIRNMASRSSKSPNRRGARSAGWNDSGRFGPRPGTAGMFLNFGMGPNAPPPDPPQSRRRG